MANRFTPMQLCKLEAQYRSNKYPTPEEKTKLSQETNLSDLQIQDWFTNHRKRSKQANKSLALSESELQVLMKYFESNPFPSKERQKMLADELKVNIRSIEAWFREKRKTKGADKRWKSIEGHPFSDAQVNVLEAEYIREPHPSLEQLVDLSKVACLNVRDIEVWFGEKRKTANGKQRVTSRKYSPEQIKAFEIAFAQNPYPDRDVKMRLSREIGVTVSQIDVWFSGRRRRRPNKRKGGIIETQGACPTTYFVVEPDTDEPHEPFVLQYPSGAIPNSSQSNKKSKSKSSSSQPSPGSVCISDLRRLGGSSLTSLASFASSQPLVPQSPSPSRPASPTRSLSLAKSMSSGHSSAFTSVGTYFSQSSQKSPVEFLSQPNSGGGRGGNVDNNGSSSALTSSKDDTTPPSVSECVSQPISSSTTTTTTHPQRVNVSVQHICAAMASLPNIGVAFSIQSSPVIRPMSSSNASSLPIFRTNSQVEATSSPVLRYTPLSISSSSSTTEPSSKASSTTTTATATNGMTILVPAGSPVAVPVTPELILQTEKVSALPARSSGSGPSFPSPTPTQKKEEGSGGGEGFVSIDAASASQKAIEQESNGTAEVSSFSTTTNYSNLAGTDYIPQLIASPTQPKAAPMSMSTTAPGGVGGGSDEVVKVEKTPSTSSSTFSLFPMISVVKGEVDHDMDGKIEVDVEVDFEVEKNEENEANEDELVGSQPSATATATQSQPTRLTRRSSSQKSQEDDSSASLFSGSQLSSSSSSSSLAPPPSLNRKSGPYRPPSRLRPIHIKRMLFYQQQKALVEAGSLHPADINEALMEEDLNAAEIEGEMQTQSQTQSQSQSQGSVVIVSRRGRPRKRPMSSSSSQSSQSSSRTRARYTPSAAGDDEDGGGEGSEGGGGGEGGGGSSISRENESQTSSSQVGTKSKRRRGRPRKRQVLGSASSSIGHDSDSFEDSASPSSSSSSSSSSSMFSGSNSTISASGGGGLLGLLAQAAASLD